jgi:hypothetical protein
VQASVFGISADLRRSGISAYLGLRVARACVGRKDFYSIM